MDWIFDHFQIVVVIAIVLASLAKRALEAKTAEREDQQDPGDIFDPGDDWEPPVNRPMPSVPPPLVRTVGPAERRPATPPPLIPQQAQVWQPRESEAELILKRQQDMQERFLQIKEGKARTTGGAAATNARVAAAQTHARAGQPAKSAKSGLRKTLRNHGEIRRAILLREILGPPVGLR